MSIVAGVGVGVAICDSRDNLIFEVKKNLEALGGGGEVLSNDAAELEALIQGLSTALTLDLRNVRFYCDDNKLYQYVTCTVRPERPRQVQRQQNYEQPRQVRRQQGYDHHEQPRQVRRQQPDYNYYDWGISLKVHPPFLWFV